MDRTGAVLVDTYRIERLIAEGGMGAVYEASHLRIPKKFAVKFLKVSLLDNSVALLRFRREAEVVATLDHPAIVSLFDYNITEDGVPYTILEYLEGEHLGDHVNRGRLPIAEVLRVTESVVGALSAAHAKGVVHRDLKPENVILCTQGAVKVVDFGIAKLRGAQELTAFNSILGTITYMAPEQLMAGHIDARADQFALGAIVYEMLSGDMPFGSEGSIPEIAERVLRQQPPPIAGYPQMLLDVILRAMAKEPAQRYQNVDAFMVAFRAVAHALGGDARVVPMAAPPMVARDLPPTIDRPTTVPVELTTVPATPIIEEGDSPIASASTMIGPAPEDPGLPELPDERTAISTPSTDQPAESTRITRPPQSTSEIATPLPMEPSRPELVTGSMGASRNGLMEKLGQRGGIIVGVLLGVMVAVMLGLLLR